MEKRKGMSPLIAAVLLIAATMTIAGILAFWTTNFVRTRLTEAEAVTGGVKCYGAEFQLRSGSYGDGTLRLILDNKRSVDLQLTNLFLIYPNNTVVTIPLNETLKGNEIKTIVRNVTDPNFLTGEIRTHCSDVSVFFTREQVT